MDDYAGQDDCYAMGHINKGGSCLAQIKSRLYSVIDVQEKHTLEETTTNVLPILGMAKFTRCNNYYYHDICHYTKLCFFYAYINSSCIRQTCFSYIL